MVTRSPEVPFSRMLQEWWPYTVTPSIDQALHQYLTLLLIWALLQNLTFYLIARGLHRTFATDAACQQRTLTSPDIWSCPTLGLASVPMLRPISLELVLFPGFLSFENPSVHLFCFVQNSIQNNERKTSSESRYIEKKKKNDIFQKLEKAFGVFHRLVAEKRSCMTSLGTWWQKLALTPETIRAISRDGY